MTGFEIDRVAFDSTVAIGWQQRAVCKSFDPDMWFEPAMAPEAKRICQNCPVWRPCGEVADDAGEQIGVRAGFDLSRRSERTKLQVALGRATQKPEFIKVICCKCREEFPTRRGYHTCPACRGMVDADPVRERITLLTEAGMTRTEIASHAGMTKHAIWYLFTGKKGNLPPHIAAHLAERINAIPVPERVMA